MHSVEEELAKRIAAGEEVVLATVIKLDGAPPSNPGAKALFTRTAQLAGTLGCSEFDAAAQAEAPEIAEGDQPKLSTYRHDLGSIEVYLEPHAPAPSLVVFCATPVAHALLRLAPDAGFRTLLVETRPERLAGAQWPEAVTTLDGLGSKLSTGAFVIHTDHDAPDLVPALEQLLPREPRFIGLVGSRRHTGHHLEALRANGVAEDVIARIQSPVGLDIGARTPSEIALSILAGLVAVRHGARGGWKQEH